MRISDWSSDVCSSDLEAVADVRKCAPHDHAHGVIEVTAAHLVLEIDGDDFLGKLGHCDSFRCGSGACPAPRKTVSRALRTKREIRSEERRVGKECGSPCRSRGSPSH